jgi:hypothetical protein
MEASIPLLSLRVACACHACFKLSIVPCQCSLGTRSNSRRCIDDGKNSTSYADDSLKTSRGSLAERFTSGNGFRLSGASSTLGSHRRNKNRLQHFISDRNVVPDALVSSACMTTGTGHGVESLQRSPGSERSSPEVCTMGA